MWKWLIVCEVDIFKLGEILNPEMETSKALIQNLNGEKLKGFVFLFHLWCSLFIYIMMYWNRHFFPIVYAFISQETKSGFVLILFFTFNYWYDWLFNN